MPGKKRGGPTARVSVQRTVDSVVIHDIKNLACRLSLLMQNMDEHFESPVFRTNMVEALADTVRRMNTMVKSFRDPAEQQVILKLKLDLNDILRTLLASLPPDTMRRVRVETSFAETPLIWGDSFYLQEAFRNLVQNAIDAMPEGGTLSVTTRRAGARKSARVEVEVRDTGIGMSAAFIRKELFQPFVTTKETGMGMGLYTARQIFELHNGRVSVKSVPDAGSMFKIQFSLDDHA